MKGRPISIALATAVASSTLALPAGASSPPAPPPEPVASSEAEAAAWARYERRRRGLIAGVAVSGAVTGVSLAVTVAGLGLNARRDSPYADYGAIGMVYVGGAFFVAGGIALVLTSVALAQHKHRKWAFGLALNRPRLHPAPGGIALRF